MNAYLQRLAAASATLPPAESRIVLLTGQSSFTTSALSPAQIAFLREVAPPGCSVVERGFPFDPSFDGVGFSSTGIIGASWRNARQVYWALHSQRFQQAVAMRLQTVLDSTRRRLVIVTGSCGLQLANAAWPHLGLPPQLRIDVIALGPACFGGLHLPAQIVRGRRDVWSRIFYGDRVDHVCGCGHLEYWESEEARVLVRGLLR
ncbi:MAG: hypothetical protein JNM66_19550 [Bryobacterales bacterium]|nr:hypothetical protein [Bryobacterales bacterium]